MKLHGVVSLFFCVTVYTVPLTFSVSNAAHFDAVKYASIVGALAPGSLNMVLKSSSVAAVLVIVFRFVFASQNTLAVSQTSCSIPERIISCSTVAFVVGSVILLRAVYIAFALSLEFITSTTLSSLTHFFIIHSLIEAAVDVSVMKSALSKELTTSGFLKSSSTFSTSFAFLSSAHCCGRFLSTLNAEPTPTVSLLPSFPTGPNGKTGSVWNTFEPKSCTCCPMVSPSALALIAANKIVHKIPIAKKFTINHENRSSEPHRSKFLNSNTEFEPT